MGNPPLVHENKELTFVDKLSAEADAAALRPLCVGNFGMRRFAESSRGARGFRDTDGFRYVDAEFRSAPRIGQNIADIRHACE